MRYVVTHKDNGILIGMLPSGICFFSRDGSGTAGADSVMAFESQAQARVVVVDRWTDGEDAANLNVVGVEAAPEASVLTFEQLRAAGLGDLLPDETTPAPGMR